MGKYQIPMATHGILEFNPWWSLAVARHICGQWNKGGFKLMTEIQYQNQKSLGTAHEYPSWSPTWKIKKEGRKMTLLASMTSFWCHVLLHIIIVVRSLSYLYPIVMVLHTAQTDVLKILSETSSPLTLGGEDWHLLVGGISVLEPWLCLIQYHERSQLR